MSNIRAVTCHACGANLVGGLTYPQQTAQYPRQQVASGPGMIQVPEGTHSVALVVVLSILFGGWAE